MLALGTLRAREAVVVLGPYRSHQRADRAVFVGCLSESTLWPAYCIILSSFIEKVQVALDQETNGRGGAGISGRMKNILVEMMERCRYFCVCVCGGRLLLGRYMLLPLMCVNSSRHGVTGWLGCHYCMYI